MKDNSLNKELATKLTMCVIESYNSRTKNVSGATVSNQPLKLDSCNDALKMFYETLKSFDSSDS